MSAAHKQQRRLHKEVAAHLPDEEIFHHTMGIFILCDKMEMVCQ